MSLHRIIGMLVAIVVVAPIAWVVTDRRPCLEVRSVEILTPWVYPGGVLRWEVVLDRIDECEFYRTSYMRDGAGAIIEFAQDNVGRIQGDAGERLVFSQIIPPGAAPGNAEYYRQGHFKRNIVNEYWPLPSVVLAHLHFIILERPTPSLKSSFMAGPN